MDLRDAAKKRAAAGDGVCAGLLALVAELEDELVQKRKTIAEWEQGKRVRSEEVWGPDE